jgi:hypothetical protein
MGELLFLNKGPLKMRAVQKKGTEISVSVPLRDEPPQMIELRPPGRLILTLGSHKADTVALVFEDAKGLPAAVLALVL